MVPISPTRDILHDVGTLDSVPITCSNLEEVELEPPPPPTLRATVFYLKYLLLIKQTKIQ